MSLFKTILSKILPGQDDHASSAPSPPTVPPQADSAAQTTRVSTLDSISATASPAGPAHAVSPPAAPASPVDIAAVLDGLAAANPGELDWRRSIVDLMKLLDLDSSPAARKELATELHYPGDSDKSAEMNVWLHQQVLRKLAENGGKVPADLLV